MIALKEILKQVDSLLAGTNADGSEREWIACEALGIKRGALPLVREVSEEQAKKMIDYARETTRVSARRADRCGKCSATPSFAA